jgi:hypothetical protein
MRFTKLFLAIGLFAMLAPNCFSAVRNSVSSPIWDKLTPAWDAVSEKLIGFAGEKNQKLLADLAFSVAAAEQCDDLSLDKNKFKSAFDALNDDKYKALSQADKDQYGYKIMNFFGIYVGLLTAEALLEPQQFCAYAANQQLIGKGPYWVE